MTGAVLADVCRMASTNEDTGSMVCPRPVLGYQWSASSMEEGKKERKTTDCLHVGKKQCKQSAAVLRRTSLM